jgi:hypothetical protein
MPRVWSVVAAAEIGHCGDADSIESFHFFRKISNFPEAF